MNDIEAFHSWMKSARQLNVYGFLTEKEFKSVLTRISKEIKSLGYCIVKVRFGEYDFIKKENLNETNQEEYELR